MDLRRSSFALAAAVVLAACGGSGPDPWVPPLPAIHGGGTVMTGYSAFGVYIHTDWSGGTPVSDAAVTLNGTPLVWDPVFSNYEAPAFEPLPNQDLVVTVVIPEGSLVAAGTYSATLKWFAALPTITSPVSGSRFTVDDEIVFTWETGDPSTGTPAPAYYLRFSEASSHDFPDAYSTPPEVPISTASFTVPAGTLPAGEYTLSVDIGTPGAWTAAGGIPIAGAAEGSTLDLVWWADSSYRFTIE